MKRFTMLSGSLILALAAAARADVPALKGPAADQLQALSAVPAPAGSTFDGSVPRREGPFTVLEESPWEERIYHPENESTHIGHDPYYPYHAPYPHHDGYGRVIYYSDHPYYGSYPYPDYSRTRTGAYTEIVRGTKQKLHIDDRGAYVRGEAKKGGLWGLLAGVLLGGILALAAPIALAAAAGAGAVAAGASIKGLIASSKPETFERVVNKTSSYEKP